ncbi:MAG: hypothetical protein M0P69_20670, partial [Bacteroidales bacterium]|nr:hypothetical protein [Bacteroidales bacterium]
DEYEDGQAYYDAIDEVYAQFADDGIVSADDATKAVKRALADFIDYDSGKLAVNEVVRQALEDMGFDGIIDKTVAWKFGSKSGKRRAMKGVTPETTHYIAFSSNQAKETTNLTPTEAPDIRHSLDLSTEELIAKWEKAKQQYGTIEPGMQPRNEERVGDTPKQVTPDKNVSRFARTAMESENTPDDFIDPAKLAILAGKGSYIVLTDKDARAWAEAKYNREGLTKAHDSWESLMKSNKMLTKNEIVFGEILMVEAAERGDYEAWEKLLTDLCAAATIAGQTVQAFSMLKKLTGPGRVMSIIKQIQTLETEINLRRKGGKQLKIEVDPALLAKLSQAKTLAEIEAIEEQIIISVAPQIPPSMSDRVIAWRYLAMLGNARTHIRNIVSNAAMAGTRNVKDVMGGAMEDLFIEPGQERTKTNRRVSAEIKEFSTQDFDNVRDTITSGGKYGFETSLQKYRRQFDTKWVDKLSKLNLQALEAEDLWFMKRAYIQSFGKYLTANKYTLEFLKSNTKESNTALAKARQYSIQEAKKATYRDDAALASALNRIERQGGVAASIIIGGLAPFKKTPINIVKRGIEYSPVGIADTFTRQASKLHKGDITAAEFIDHLCAGMTGSALFVLGMFLGLHGWMIAGGDDDDKKNEYYQQDLGKQNYAVNILGYSVTLDWLTPSSMPLMAGVELATTVVKDDYDFDINGLLEALIKTADPVTELSLLQGVNDALTTYDANRIGGVASSAVMSYAGQFLPTMGGQVARVVDPIRRSTYAATDTSVLGGKRVEQFFRKAGNKIPGVSTKNEPYIDVWGRTQNRNESDGSGVLNFAGRVAEQMIFPGYVKERKQTAVDDEIARVFAVNNNKTVIPSKPESSFTTEGETYYLKPKELTRLQEQAGQTAYRVLEEVFKSPAYQTADQETKESMIGNVYTYAKKVAKADFLETSGNETVTPPDGLDKVEAAKDVGLNEGVYLSTMKVIGGIKGDIDPTTGKATSRDKIGLTTRKTKVRNYLAEQGFTRNQINFILAANNYSIN